MKQYSFIVQCPSEVTLHEVGLALDAGRNVFTVVTKDLEALLVLFDVEGVQVLELNRLDAPETTASDLLLEGESPAVINVHAWRSGS